VPEPFTVAVHCAVASAATAAGAQAGVTEVMLDEVVEVELEELLLLPPQAVSASRAREIPRTCRNACLSRFLVGSRRELPTQIWYA
jgi:hypothetical protein